MSNFITLTKAFFLSGISVNRRKNSQKPVFKQLGLFALIFLAASTFYNIMFFFTPMLSDIQQAGEEMIVNELDSREILIYMLSAAAMLTFVTTFGQMQGTIFSGKDYEFIESLPVKTPVVISAKIASVYILCIAEDLLIFLPTVVCYFIKTGDSGGSAISFIAVFFASMVPLLLSSLLGTVTVLIIKRLKYKNVFQVIIYFLYFALIFALMFNSYGMRNIANSPILKLLPHFSFFRAAVFGRDILQLLIFVGINLGAFALVVLFISCLYKPINSMKQYAGSGKFNERGRAAASQISVLLKKDLKMIVNKPALLVNSVMGPIMFAITAAMMLIMPIEGKSNGDVPPDITLLAVGVMFGLMMCSATNAASSSLSFEGKNFELLLSYPVKHTVVLRSKLISSFVIPSAIALISSSVILGLSFAKGFVTGNSIPLIISIFIGPQLSLIYATVMSLICNLRWPKLDFESDIQVTKNSKSVLFATLFCTLPALPIGAIVLILSLILPPAGLIAMLFIYAGLITFSSILLKTKGKSLYFGLTAR